MAATHLATYLNDHLAGATAGLNLLEHLAPVVAGGPLAPLVAWLRADIAEDKRLLEEAMARNSVAQSMVRKAMGWLAEQAAQLKLKMDDKEGGSLRLLEALEAISLGVEGKRCLWRALAAAGVPGADHAALERRAEEQRRRLEEARLLAAREALR
ncbi:MAG: hypothetical protein K2W96_08450 [Gemmataceae bacterium]|nr:hypothetical protein [Gemmataceae bacterium]